MGKCIIIKPDGNISLTNYPHRASIGEENDCLRKLIGEGCELFESVRFRFTDRILSMLVDEEGILKKDLELNNLATMLYGNWIWGTAVIVEREINDHGEEIFCGFGYNDALLVYDYLKKISAWRVCQDE